MDATTALVLVYRQAYIALLQRIAKRAQAGKSIVYDAAMARDVRQILDELDEVTAQWARTVVPRLYSDGVKLAAAAWIANNAKPPAIAKGFAQVHRAAVEAIAANMTNQLRDATAYVGRRIEDNVRRATLEAAAQKFATGQRLKDMKRELVQTLIDDGLTAIRDGSGREWRLDTYAEMVTRSTTAEAANAGLINQLKGYGHDLVQLSEHRAACPICAPYEGRVYSMTGKTEGYPRLDQVPGFDMGYMNFHPNCRHAVTAYLPEFDKDAERTKERSSRPFADERTEADKRAYARSQEQNKLRRDRKRLEERVATLPKGTPEYEAAREKLREVRGQQNALGREERKWREQAARENRAYYAARDSGQAASWPGRIDEAPMEREPDASATVRARYDRMEEFVGLTAETVESAPPEAGDRTLYRICEMQGYTAKPQVVSETELNTFAARGEVELCRGIMSAGGRTGEDMCKQFQDGMLYVGSGVYGNGTYCVVVTPESREGALKMAQQYAGGGGSVLRMTLKADARVITYDDLRTEWDKEVKPLLKAKYGRQPLTPEQRIMADLGEDWGHYAAMKGYDAYICQRGDADYCVVLNRSACRVQKSLLPGLW